MAATFRTMTLGQSYPHHHHHHHQLVTSSSNRVIMKTNPHSPPPTPPSSVTSISPPLLLTSSSTTTTTLPFQQQQQQQVHNHRPIAPALNLGLQMRSQLIRINNSSGKQTTSAKGSKLRLAPNNNNSHQNHHHHVSQYSSAGSMPSVERRNARERNRVKQVNNGYDKLRQHIPSKIVEKENGGRGVSKKLSKVDTLRLAAKYIQGLKKMLNDNDNRLQEITGESLGTSLARTDVTGGGSSTALSYYSASPAPSQQQLPSYVVTSTPISYHRQDDQHIASEGSISPAPSFISDISAGHQQTQPLYLPTSQAQFTAGTYQQQTGYDAIGFEDDSGSFEEEAILDDILHWQLQH